MQGCDSSNGASVLDANTTKDPRPDASADSTSPVDSAARDDIIDSLWTLDVSEQAPPDAGPAPIVPCGLDAAIDSASIDSDADLDASTCALPASKCIGESWLVSYMSGTCVDGTCEFFRVYHDCRADSAGSFCMGGHCTSGGIAK